MFQVKVNGLEQLKAQLDGFSDRRFAAAVATALTRTGQAIREQWKQELQARIDRPTALTANAPRLKMATASELVATVSMRSEVPSGTPPSQYLQPLEYGGGREHKKFERALIAQGSMPPNTYALPTDNAERDGFGNVRRQVLVQVLVQLAGGSVSRGYRRVISASAQRRAQAAIRAGRDYLAVLNRTDNIYPGIYQRGKDGALKMIFAYESSVRYRRTTSLVDRARESAPRIMTAELKRAVEESMARLAAKGRA
ncbi:MAG: hypothetical protein MUF16_10170 [Burkholderiaceae bacterium]|nr:hypothetical protein [Burkholderiaceae bacterium]